MKASIRNGTRPKASVGRETYPLTPAVRKALAARPQARAIFEKMPPSHRREYLKWIAEAKKEETRQRRIDQLATRLLAKASCAT